MTLTHLQINYSDLSQLEKVAAQIIDFAQDDKIWLLEGDMGTGKTTLIKEVCRQMGVTKTVQSPTYSIVNEYVAGDGKPIYHFDFYRIKTEIEAMDIGCEEYFDSGYYCLIEWPSKIPSLLPAAHVRIQLSLENQYQRIIHLSKHE